MPTSVPVDPRPAAAVDAAVASRSARMAAGRGCGRHELLGTGRHGGHARFRQPNVPAYVLTALGSAAVLWGRRRPLVALVISGCCATLLAWMDQHVDILPFVITGLMFMVGRNLPRRPAVAMVVFGLAGLAVSALSQPPDLGLRRMLESMGIFVTAWVLGRLTRARGQVLQAQLVAAERQGGRRGGPRHAGPGGVAASDRPGAPRRAGPLDQRHLGPSHRG